MNSLIDLRHLRTLMALKETGSLSRASELLNLTQSALSHQIKVLEDNYKASLFERKSSPFLFTPLGEKLFGLAQKILPHVDETEREIQQMLTGPGGDLRIAVECHTCFDWLMPALSRFRPRWPEVDFDFVSGFHSHPSSLVLQGKADLAILSEKKPTEGLFLHPLFQFQIVAVLATDHPLAAKSYLEAQDFAGETLITYPVPDENLDLIRLVLKPAGVFPTRRTSELTNAILQLVASRKGIAALPVWAVHTYLDHQSMAIRPITRGGLQGELYAAVKAEKAELPYILDFIQIIRETSYLTLPEIRLFD